MLVEMLGWVAEVLDGCAVVHKLLGAVRAPHPHETDIDIDVSRSEWLSAGESLEEENGMMVSHMSSLMCAAPARQSAIVYYSAKNLIHVDIWFFHRSAIPRDSEMWVCLMCPTPLCGRLLAVGTTASRCRARGTARSCSGWYGPDGRLYQSVFVRPASRAASTRSNGASALGGSVSSTVSWVRPKSRRRR